MALTIAHHSNRDALTWDDLVEAMTTLEAGTAVGVEYIPEESRAVAIHEAGHAAAGHAYLKGAESTRLSIRMRGGALGHHQALEKEERFSRFRCEEFARLVWALGAMAAERVFYGENSNGVGGDVMSVTAQAAYMVGASAMGPEPFADEAARGRDRGGSARAHPQALREDRPSDRQPHERRRAVRREPDRLRHRPTATSARSSASSSARRTSPPTTWSSRTARRSSTSPTCSTRGASSSATSSSTCSTSRRSRFPRSTCPRRARGRRCDGQGRRRREAGLARGRGQLDRRSPGDARRPRAPPRLPEPLCSVLRRARDRRGRGRRDAARPRRPREPRPRSRLVGVGAHGKRRSGAPPRSATTSATSTASRAGRRSPR